MKLSQLFESSQSHLHHVVSIHDGRVLASYKTREEAEKNAHGNPVVTGEIETIGDVKFVKESSQSHLHHVVSVHDGRVLASYKTHAEAEKNAHGNPVVCGEIETIGDVKFVKELCPGCHSADIKTYSDHEKECNHCHKTWDVKSVLENYKEMEDLPVVMHKSPYEGANVGEYTEMFMGVRDAQKFAKYIISKGGKARIGKRGPDAYVYHSGAGPISKRDARMAGVWDPVKEGTGDPEEGWCLVMANGKVTGNIHSDIADARAQQKRAPVATTLKWGKRASDGSEEFVQTRAVQPTAENYKDEDVSCADELEKSDKMEDAPELLKAEMPLVRHIEQELAAHGYEKGTEEYKKAFDYSIAFYRKFGNVDLIKKQSEA